MMPSDSRSEELLYSLLPAHFRRLDETQEVPYQLRAFLRVLESQYRALDSAAQQLYRDWFIQTCRPEVVPDLAQIVGLSEIESLPAAILPTLRGGVANATSSSRRKGINAALEHAALGWTGWYAAARDSGRTKLAAAQTVLLPRPERGRTFDVRTGPAAVARTPFDRVARTPAVSSGSPGRAARRAAATLHLWRLQTFRRSGAEPSREASRALCFYFGPWREDTPLFNLPRSQPRFELANEPHTLPVRLRREVLSAELRERRLGLEPGTDFFGRDPVLEIRVQGVTGDWVPVPIADLSIGDLSRWAGEAPEVGEARVSAVVDPELGRFRLAGPNAVRPVRVTYTFARSAPVGAVPYGSEDRPTDPDTWNVVVYRAATAAYTDSGVRSFDDVQAALNAFAKRGGNGHIRILDDGTYPIDDRSVGRDPEGCCIAPGADRSLTIEAVGGATPMLCGSIGIVGSEPGTRIAFKGLSIEGTLTLSGDVEVEIERCTIFPRSTGPAIQVDRSHPGLRVHASHSILGSVHLPTATGGCVIEDSVVDGLGSPAILGRWRDDFSATVTMRRTTVRGAARASRVDLEDSILTDPLAVEELEQSRIAYCYIAPGSTAPPVHPGPIQGPPEFTSTRRNAPGYMQLSTRCPIPIRQQASNGSELGVFNALHNRDRERLLQRVVTEYGRQGVDLSVHTET